MPAIDLDIPELLRRIRRINRLCTEGKISWQKRVRLHNQLVPGIGPLGGDKRGRRKDRAQARRG
jgi:hypothetical protein